MTEKTKPKSAKKKPKKAAAQKSVLGSLPATRPSRLGRHHDGPQTPAAEAGNGPASVAAASATPRAVEPAKKAGTTGKPAAARRKAPAKATASAPKTTATTTAATAAAQQPSGRGKAAAPKAAKPPLKAAPEPPPAPKTFEPAATPEAPRRGPRPVRPGSPPLGQTERREPAPAPENGGAPRGTELVTTAIQAAGELAQIGITVGSQILKRTLDRLPKP
jgi:hypothetical protein